MLITLLFKYLKVMFLKFEMKILSAVKIQRKRHKKFSIVLFMNDTIDEFNQNIKK